jgi:hypothetical protein
VEVKAEVEGEGEVIGFSFTLTFASTFRAVEVEVQS